MVHILYSILGFKNAIFINLAYGAISVPTASSNHPSFHSDELTAVLSILNPPFITPILLPVDCAD